MHTYESFDKAADWLYNGMGEAFDNNTARMAIAGDDPMLLADIDPEKVSRANKANAIAYKPARERILSLKLIGILSHGLEKHGLKEYFLM